MKKFILFIFLLSLFSCSTIKRATETTKKSDLQMSHRDSSASQINTGSILESIITRIDSSRITITDYSFPDTAGRQSVIRITVVENNIKTTQKAIKKDSVKAIAVQIVKDSTSQKSIEKTKITEQRKPQTVNKIIFQIVAYFILAIIAFIGIKWLKNKIKSIFSLFF